MALSNEIRDREFNKFVDDGSGNTAVRVTSTDSAGVVEYDVIEIDETDPANVVISFKVGGVTLKTKTISENGAITTITKS